MWRATFAGIIVVLLLIHLGSIAKAEGENKPEILVDAEGINTLLNPKKPIDLNTEFVEENSGLHEIVVGVIAAIDYHKNRARDAIAYYTYWDRVIQGSLITLAFLTTVLAAIARTYRDKVHKHRNVVGLLPVITAALVTLVSSFQGHYTFGDLRDRNTIVADELAFLQSEINYQLMRRAAVAESEKKEFTVNNVDDWYERLSEVLNRAPDSEGSEKVQQARNPQQ